MTNAAGGEIDPLDTIIALSSGTLPAAVAVIRASGASARSLIESFIGHVPRPREAEYCVLRDQVGNEVDRGLVLWFPGPSSFTGEDCVEFQVHGSRAVVDEVLATATAFDDVRLAEPGEFARRAFANGKLDLTAAEALADLIAAETDAQRRFALQQTSGSHRELYDGWRGRLLHARAMIEAEIDFADEDDVPGSVSDQVWTDVRAVVDEISTHIGEGRRGRIMRSGFEIVLVGRPNAGKSTLLNRLAGSDRAIVSSVPGTTRDVVDVRLDIGGYLVTIADTAGLRESGDLLEIEGMRRAVQRAGEADLVLHLSDSAEFDGAETGESVSKWLVHTKSDLSVPKVSDLRDAPTFVVSAVTGDGMNGLVEAIKREIQRHLGVTNDIAPSRTRHMEHLEAALVALSDSAAEQNPLEVRAEHLRLASDELGRITGRIDVEDLLGSIFSQFCVGK